MAEVQDPRAHGCGPDSFCGDTHGQLHGVVGRGQVSLRQGRGDLMAVELDESPKSAAAIPDQGGSRVDVRIRPRSFQRDDLVLLVVSAIAALAVVVLVYAGLTIQAGTPGLIIWWYAAFLAIH